MKIRGAFLMPLLRKPSLTRASNSISESGLNGNLGSNSKPIWEGFLFHTDSDVDHSHPCITPLQGLGSLSNPRLAMGYTHSWCIPPFQGLGSCRHFIP